MAQLLLVTICQDEHNKEMAELQSNSAREMNARSQKCGYRTPIYIPERCSVSIQFQQVSIRAWLGLWRQPTNQPPPPPQPGPPPPLPPPLCGCVRLGVTHRCKTRCIYCLLCARACVCVCVQLHRIVAFDCCCRLLIMKLCKPEATAHSQLFPVSSSLPPPPIIAASPQHSPHPLFLWPHSFKLCFVQLRGERGGGRGWGDRELQGKIAPAFDKPSLKQQQQLALIVCAWTSAPFPHPLPSPPPFSGSVRRGGYGQTQPNYSRIHWLLCVCGASADCFVRPYTLVG